MIMRANIPRMCTALENILSSAVPTPSHNIALKCEQHPHKYALHSDQDYANRKWKAFRDSWSGRLVVHPNNKTLRRIPSWNSFNSSNNKIPYFYHYEMEGRRRELHCTSPPGKDVRNNNILMHNSLSIDFANCP